MRPLVLPIQPQHSVTQADLVFKSYANYKDQSGLGCLHVTHYIIFYLITIYLHLWAKWVISHYDSCLLRDTSTLNKNSLKLALTFLFSVFLFTCYFTIFLWLFLSALSTFIITLKVCLLSFSSFLGNAIIFIVPL